MPTILNVIGALLVALPFIGLAWALWAEDGWKAVFFVFGGSAVVLLSLHTGLKLLGAS